MPTYPPRHLKPTLADLLTPPFFSFFLLFIKQEKVDRYMLVNANCLYSHRHSVISEPNIQRKEKS
ncbi:hypothetical protein ACRRTK_000375 [Alexandromys fortis]